VRPSLARTLRSTNPIESMVGICRDHAASVKNWRDGQMGAAVVRGRDERGPKQFRRVNGFMHLGRLHASLDRHVSAQESATTCYDKTVA
jgi:hypothetical protein